MEHKEHVHIHKEGFSKYVPLIVIFLVVFGLTGLIVFLSGGQGVSFIMRIFMAIFFAVFGLFKLVKLSGFAEAYQKYDVIAMRSKVYAHLYPFIELGLAIAYYLNFRPLVINWFTFILMTISAYGVYLKLNKKEEIVCACLGTVFKVPMTYVTLGEDLVMAIMALIMIVGI